MPVDSLPVAGEDNIREGVRAFHVVEGGPGASIDREDGGKQLCGQSHPHCHAGHARRQVGRCLG